MRLCELVYDTFVCFSYNGSNTDLKVCSEDLEVCTSNCWGTCLTLFEISHANVFHFAIEELLL